jgi:hypothetical protein
MDIAVDTADAGYITAAVTLAAVLPTDMPAGAADTLAAVLLTDIPAGVADTRAARRADQ